MNTSPAKYDLPQTEKNEFAIDDIDMGMLLSSVGNHANKLILLAAMEPSTIYQKYGGDTTYSLLRDLQADSSSEGWVPEATTTYNYLVNSLAPIGMVAKEYIDETEGTIGYQLTERGRTTGVALAGYLLDFSARHNIALSQLFGDTTSRYPDARAGALRWRIFQGLATQVEDTPVSVTELAESISESPSRVLSNLAELNEVGVVHYEAGTKRQRQTYKVDLAELAAYLPRMHRGKSSEVARQVLDAGIDTYTVASLAEQLTLPAPDQNTPQFRSSLKTILSNLEKAGICERLVERSGDAKVWVDSSQQSMLTDLLQCIDRLQVGGADTIEKGGQLARAIISDPDAVTSLMAHEKDVSVHYHGQQNARLRGERILQILSHSDQPLTYDQLHDRLRDMGDIVSTQGIARVIKGTSGITSIGEAGHGSKLHFTIQK